MLTNVVDVGSKINRLDITQILVILIQFKNIFRCGLLLAKIMNIKFFF